MRDSGLDLAAAAGGAVLAEVCYTRDDGSLDATVVTPLVDGDDVVVALCYAQRQLAYALAAAEQAAVVISDRRMALAGWAPLAAVGRIELSEDLDGSRFRERLIDEEIRKHPPSRLLADSLMARHEHWWFMPRLLCRLVDVDAVYGVAARDDPHSGVLGWSEGGRLRVDTVDVHEDAGAQGALQAGGGEVRRLVSRTGALLDGEDALACLVRHDFSVPDLERRTTLVERGRVRLGALVVEEASGALELPPPPRLLTRIRRHRALARDCRRELAGAREQAASA